MIWRWIMGIGLSLLFSCGNQQLKADLCQSWRYDLSAIRRELSNRDTDFATVSYMESIMGGLQHARLRFAKDGKLDFQLDDLKQSGRWRFRKRGKELVLRFTDQEQVHEIVRLNTDTLILTPISGEGLPFSRILVRDTVQ